MIAAGLFIVVACGSPDELTPTISWTPLPLASNVPVPTPTTVPIGSEPVALPRTCLNDAVFLEDLTIPDQTIVDANEPLDKRWSVQNNGTCDWGPGYRLVHISRDDFQAEEAIALFPARAGAVASWQVEMKAPFKPGEHIGIWQASSPEGEFFGEQVYLWVIVSTPTPVPTSRGTPTN
jgi:hypothetical protein